MGGVAFRELSWGGWRLLWMMGGGNPVVHGMYIDA